MHLPAPVDSALHAHWQFLMLILAGWSAIASILARCWPKPSTDAKWYAKAGHFLAIDLPSWVATLDGKSWLGFRFSIPFITWTVRDTSAATPPPPPANRQAGRVDLLTLLLVCGAAVMGLLLFAGCAPGTDGLRQTCSNADQVLAGVYSTGTALYRADQAALRARVTKDNADAIAATAAAHDAAFDKFLDVMATASTTKSATCAMADAVDAGVKADVPALVSQVAKIIADISNGIADLKRAFKDFKLARLPKRLARGKVA